MYNSWKKSINPGILCSSSISVSIIFFWCKISRFRLLPVFLQCLVLFTQWILGSSMNHFVRFTRHFLHQILVSLVTSSPARKKVSCECPVNSYWLVSHGTSSHQCEINASEIVDVKVNYEPCFIKSVFTFFSSIISIDINYFHWNQSGK